MANELTTYGGASALVEASRGNYKVNCPITGATTMLRRDVDFGVVPGTKSPSLLKAGAEKIVNVYGLLTHYTIESKVEDIEKPLFMYTVKCELVKVGVNGEEYVFTTGYGSANTYEKRNGRNSAWDAANSTLKMAQKRALVSAAISIGGLSDAFTMDMEDEKAMSEGYNKIAKTADPNEKINNAQLKRLYAIGGDYGITAKECKDFIKSLGFNSPTDIKNGEYDEVINKFKAYAEKGEK